MPNKYYIVDKYVHHDDFGADSHNVVIEVTKSGGYKFANFVDELKTLEEAKQKYPKAEHIEGEHDKSLLGALTS